MSGNTSEIVDDVIVAIEEDERAQVMADLHQRGFDDTEEWSGHA
jgi:hypothetical protein